MLPALSFWKVDPVPPRSQKIEVADLKSIGNVKDVINNLLSIPRIHKPVPTVYDILHDNGQVKFLWNVENGVILYFTPDDKENIEVIYTVSYVKDRLFYKLYVQLYERFEVTLLDGSFTKCFLTPRDFKELFVNGGKGDTK